MSADVTTDDTAADPASDEAGADEAGAAATGAPTTNRHSVGPLVVLGLVVVVVIAALVVAIVAGDDVSATAVRVNSSEVSQKDVQPAAPRSRAGPGRPGRAAGRVSRARSCRRGPRRSSRSSTCSARLVADRVEVGAAARRKFVNGNRKELAAYSPPASRSRGRRDAAATKAHQRPRQRRRDQVRSSPRPACRRPCRPAVRVLEPRARAGVPADGLREPHGLHGRRLAPCPVGSPSSGSALPEPTTCCRRHGRRWNRPSAVSSAPAGTLRLPTWRQTGCSSRRSTTSTTRRPTSRRHTRASPMW